MYTFVFKSSLRFVIIHISLHLINYITTYIHFYTCFNFYNGNIFKSFLYSFLFNSSEYCYVLSNIMTTISGITRSMWTTIGVTICMECIEQSHKQFIQGKNTPHFHKP